MEISQIELSQKRECVEWDGRKVQDVLSELNTKLHEAGIPRYLNYGCPWWPSETGKDAMWPSWTKGRHWPACYPVRGSSEAYYAHIDMISTTRRPALFSMNWRIGRSIAFVRCDTWQEACAIAALSAQLLDAVI